MNEHLTVSLALPGAAGGAARSRGADGLRRVEGWLLLTVVAVLPIPFGGARPWAWNGFAAAVGAMLILAGWRMVLDPRIGWRRFRLLTLPAALFAAAAAWLALQASTATPDAWHHPVWTLVADALDAPPGAVSADPARSVQGLLRLLSYAGLLWLSVEVGLDAVWARRALVSVVLAGAAYALYGLLVFVSGNETILWFTKWAYRPDLTSTFVNRNSFATYAGLSLVACIALVIETFRERTRFGESWRGVLSSVLETASTRASWLIAAACAISMALLLTHSRGGVAATLFGSVALFVAAGRSLSLRAPWRLLVALAFLVGAIGLLALSGEQLLVRVATSDLAEDYRSAIYALAAEALQDRPWLGHGLGSFRAVFSLYRTEELPLPADLAHSDILQNALEMGLPASTLYFLGIASLGAVLVRGARTRRRGGVFPCAAIGATSLVALHSLVDFSLQIPAVAATYCLLLGIGVAQSFRTQDRASIS